MRVKSYSDYSTSTQKYITAVKKHLRDQYGKINDEWELGLELLADKVELYTKCREFIKENGLVMTAKNGAPCKSPLIKVMFDSEIQITKYLAEFGLSPKAAAKLVMNGDDDDDELKELLG